MKKLLATLALFLCLGAQADELRDRAVAGQTADVVVTAVGLALVDGIKEANPLGVAIVPAKVGLLYWADQIEDPAARADVHRAISFTGWGPVVHNICSLSVVASGGGSIAPCAVAGIIAGIADWHHTAGMRDQAIRDTICERAKAANPDNVCADADAEVQVNLQASD